MIGIEPLKGKIGLVSFNEFAPWFEYGLINEHGCLPIILGRQRNGEELIIDLAQMPHLLIAGSTGAGKSVLLHSIICSLIRSKALVKLALIDPKRIEFGVYRDITQLLYPIINTGEEALEVLGDLIEEMNDRFILLDKAGANNIQEYNKLRDPIFYIAVILDEFSDLQRNYRRDFRDYISTLANKARAVGIHLVIATQHPVVNVISGVIKANFASRIALKTASANDSRVILDINGAERLAGKGDAIISAGGLLDMVRFQTAFISRNEIEQLTNEYKRKQTFKDAIASFFGIQLGEA